MGKTLRKMHTPVAQGYGGVKEGRAQFPTFIEWIDSEDMQSRTEYVLEHALLKKEHGTFEQLRKVLIQHVETHPNSSYCHDDFGAANIFATEPITVFDPNPRFNSSHIDLGRSLLIRIANETTSESMTQLISGYFREEPYDEKALHAAITLAAYMKFPYWYKTISNRGEMIERVKSFLKNHSDLLN